MLASLRELSLSQRRGRSQLLNNIIWVWLPQSIFLPCSFFHTPFAEPATSILNPQMNLERLSFHLPLFNCLCSSLKIRMLSNSWHKLWPCVADTSRVKHVFNKLPFSLPFRGRNSALWLTLLPGDTNFLCVSMSRVAFVSACMFFFHSHSVRSFHQTHVLNS